MRIKLKDLKTFHIEGFYKALYEKGLSGNSVLHFHILIRECLQYAFKNGVPMKQIQEWLGHADFGTTANIYSHLDYSAKQNSANTISNVFSFVESKPKQEEHREQKQEQDTNDKTKELEEILTKLEQQIKEQEEDEEYREWLREKEERRKRRKQSDMEM